MPFGCLKLSLDTFFLLKGKFTETMPAESSKFIQYNYD